MYLHLDDYPPYSGKKSDIFETHINSNLRCIHGYCNRMRHTDLITWVSNYACKMLLSRFIHAVLISPCPRTTVCNKCAQSNISDHIFITRDNANDEDIFGFSESYFKTAPSHLDECTKHKILKLQQDNVRPQNIIENPNLIPDETYQMYEPDDNNSDEKDQIGKIMKKTIIEN